MNKPKAIISLFDLTGQAVIPWADAGWTCFIFDRQHDCDSFYPNVINTGGDCSTWIDEAAEIFEAFDVRLIMSWPPCDDLAGSGARWYKAKAEANPNYLNEAVARALLGRTLGEKYGVPWMVENPVGVLSNPKNFGKPTYYFSPHQYGGYLPADDDGNPYPNIVPNRDAYTKKTCLWTGNDFVMPLPFPVPAEKFQDKNGLNYSALHWKLGGKSLRTKNIRSATPRGFAQAVFAANS